MDVQILTDVTLGFDEGERWDQTFNATTINVEELRITRYNGRIVDLQVEYSGRRRLKRGGLSVRPPICLRADHMSIPPRLWLELKRRRLV